MNIFKALVGRVWHDSNATELVKISTGQLYLVRPGNIRTSRECIYNDAMATIRRVPSVEHNFQLVVTRVYEEEELLEDEDETDEERVFLIGEELDFRTGHTEGEPTFVWRDMEGGVDEFFEFVAGGTNEPTQALFETCMYRAMYERKYKRAADHLNDVDLQEFIYKPPEKRKQKSKPASPRKKSSEADATAAITSRMQSLAVSSEPSSQSSATTTSSFGVTSPFDSYTIIADQEAELHLWDRERGYFIKHHDGRAIIAGRPTNSKANGYSYWVIARSTEKDDNGQAILWHQVDPEMNQKWATKVSSLTWNHMGDNGVQTSWCFRFLTQESYAIFQEQFTRALWETLHQVPWSSSKRDEQEYALRANEDVEMYDVEDDEDEEEAVTAELDAEDEEEDEGQSEEEDELPEEFTTGDKNSQLAVGFKGDRSYVVRGNKIGVFRHSRDQDKVEYYATIGNIANTKGKKFNPKKVMLHDSDNKMILFDETAPNSLFALDIERGKVVEEWKVDDYVPVNHIAPKEKYAQTTGEQTVVGISGNALYRIDPRLSGNKMVQAEMKQYASKTKFSTVTTTGSGKVAVAGDKGDIKLFDSIGKNAKTALPALGDPILGIDVSGDGRWIVATTKTYLLLIDAMIGDGKYAGSLGFERAFPADAKPMPKRLQLRAEHVAYMDHSISFTPARFNMGESQEENAIVTSTGEYVVAWDFNKVKKGHLDKYHIKKYEDQVVQDNFKFGDDKEIIVALQNNVLALNKKQLKRPTRASLAPGPLLQSHSGIVHSPW